MVIDKKEKVCHVLEFKQVMERSGGEQEKTKGEQSYNITVWSEDWERY